jgi:NAD(P)-dependent dehydrogenase (short-subunit alcohol dehydrogenase family)
LNNWSREAALELKAGGISLNVVNPGWVKISMGGGAAVDSVLDGVQAALYLAVTHDSPSGIFLQRFEKEKPQEGILQICTRSWYAGHTWSDSGSHWYLVHEADHIRDN